MGENQAASSRAEMEALLSNDENGGQHADAALSWNTLEGGVQGSFRRDSRKKSRAELGDLELTRILDDDGLSYDSWSSYESEI
jgi:hypothetical protein